jgi:hypothetical protein
MAGTLTITYQEHRTVRRVELDWLSTAGGAVSGIATKALSGRLERVVFLPDSGGTQPTNLYDVVLNDPDGLDVLQGIGANLANNADTQAAPVLDTYFLPLVDGALTLVVSNAGNAKGGKVILYLR